MRKNVYTSDLRLVRAIRTDGIVANVAQGPAKQPPCYRQTYTFCRWRSQTGPGFGRWSIGIVRVSKATILGIRTRKVVAFLYYSRLLGTALELNVILDCRNLNQPAGTLYFELRPVGRHWSDLVVPGEHAEGFSGPY